MKILFINYECPPLGGGRGVASFQLAVELAKRHDVNYLTMGYRDLPSSENVNGVKIIRIPVLNRENYEHCNIYIHAFLYPCGIS